MKNRKIQPSSTSVSVYRTILQKKKLQSYFYWMQQMNFCMLYISMLSCLAWTNYNFLIILFGYFVWIQREDLTALDIMKALAYFCILYDSLFIFINLIDWEECIGNQISNKKKGIYDLGMILFCINFICRLIKLYLISKCCWILQQIK